LGKAVMATIGAAHSLLLTSEGGLWAWDDNGSGHLGTVGPEQFKLTPVRVRDSRFVTEAGILWLFGQGAYGALGYHDINERREPTQVESYHFDDAKIVSAESLGSCH